MGYRKIEIIDLKWELLGDHLNRLNGYLTIKYNNISSKYIINLRFFYKFSQNSVFAFKTITFCDDRLIPENLEQLILNDIFGG